MDHRITHLEADAALLDAACPFIRVRQIVPTPT
jgi:hypothetical protein